jgi:hypothetical protein
MPIEKDKITHAIENARTTLERVASEIAFISFPDPKYIEFQLEKLSDSYIEEVVKTVPAGYAKEYEETDFLYILKLVDADEAKKKAIADNFTKYRDIQNTEGFEGKRDCCRYNDKQSDYLYIGRSQKLRSRLRQHLGATNEGIFAMHMLRWSAGLECKIEVSFYKFESQDNLIVQALEDGLWQSFCPMFGRKGEK